MRVLCIMTGVFMAHLFLTCHAWTNIADFECAATNALNHSSILVSKDFGNELTNYIATISNHESEMAARIVLGERYLTTYNETMDIQCLQDALSVATNVCALTDSETNSWYCWQSKLLVFTCHAQNNEMSFAYSVASNALDKIGISNIIATNIISHALLKHNQVEELSIRQSIVLSKALSAAMLKKNEEAINLASVLPLKYQNMVIRALNSD